MSVLIKHMAMPKGCIYANDKDQTEYCPLLNHDDVPFCQYIETEPEIAIGIDERPVYCPLFDVSESCQDTVSRAAAIDALGEGAMVNYQAAGHGNGLIKAIDVIKGLPSAQSEHTCVNCGRTVNNGGWYADGGTRCPIEEHYALPKDGYCHLWEKRNVTDDDYPERREE